MHRLRGEILSTIICHCTDTWSVQTLKHLHITHTDMKPQEKKSPYAAVLFPSPGGAAGLNQEQTSACVGTPSRSLPTTDIVGGVANARRATVMRSSAVTASILAQISCHDAIRESLHIKGSLNLITTRLEPYVVEERERRGGQRERENRVGRETRRYGNGHGLLFA